MDTTNPSSSRNTADRKTIERNRRNQMKALYSQLNSLVTHQDSKERGSLPDQVDVATRYIKKLQMKLERMRERKESLMGVTQSNLNNNNNNMSRSTGRPMKIEVNEMGSSNLEIVLVTGLDCQYSMLYEIVRLLHEDGAEVVNASFSVANDTIFHAIHAKLGDADPSDGTSRISQRLQKFIEDINSA